MVESSSGNIMGMQNYFVSNYNLSQNLRNLYASFGVDDKLPKSIYEDRESIIQIIKSGTNPMSDILIKSIRIMGSHIMFPDPQGPWSDEVLEVSKGYKSNTLEGIQNALIMNYVLSGPMDDLERDEKNTVYDHGEEFIQYLDARSVARGNDKTKLFRDICRFHNDITKNPRAGKRAISNEASYVTIGAWLYFYENRAILLAAHNENNSSNVDDLKIELEEVSRKRVHFNDEKETVFEKPMHESKANIILGLGSNIYSASSKLYSETKQELYEAGSDAYEMSVDSIQEMSDVGEGSIIMGLNLTDSGYSKASSMLSEGKLLGKSLYQTAARMISRSDNRIIAPSDIYFDFFMKIGKKVGSSKGLFSDQDLKNINTDSIEGKKKLIHAQLQNIYLLHLSQIWKLNNDNVPMTPSLRSIEELIDITLSEAVSNGSKFNLNDFTTEEYSKMLALTENYARVGPAKTKLIKEQTSIVPKIVAALKVAVGVTAMSLLITQGSSAYNNSRQTISDKAWMGSAVNNFQGFRDFKGDYTLSESRLGEQAIPQTNVQAALKALSKESFTYDLGENKVDTKTRNNAAMNSIFSRFYEMDPSTIQQLSHDYSQEKLQAQQNFLSVITKIINSNPSVSDLIKSGGGVLDPGSLAVELRKAVTDIPSIIDTSDSQLFGDLLKANKNQILSSVSRNIGLSDKQTSQLGTVMEGIAAAANAAEAFQKVLKLSDRVSSRMNMNDKDVVGFVMEVGSLHLTAKHNLVNSQLNTGNAIRAIGTMYTPVTGFNPQYMQDMSPAEQSLRKAKLDYENLGGKIVPVQDTPEDAPRKIWYTSVINNALDPVVAEAKFKPALMRMQFLRSAVLSEKYVKDANDAYHQVMDNVGSHATFGNPIAKHDNSFLQGTSIFNRLKSFFYDASIPKGLSDLELSAFDKVGNLMVDAILDHNVMIASINTIFAGRVNTAMLLKYEKLYNDILNARISGDQVEQKEMSSELMKNVHNFVDDYMYKLHGSAALAYDVYQEQYGRSMFAGLGSQEVEHRILSDADQLQHLGLLNVDSVHNNVGTSLEINP